jgi:NAD(P)-dependent dehydrogenase (short-subunit alcohol dehydrogenase family)
MSAHTASPLSPRFRTRRAIVTGGASGIGAELVRSLIDEGARVAVIDRDASGMPDGSLAFSADLADPAALDRAFAEAIAALGGVDLLFNNAGIASTTSVVDCGPDEWDAVLAVNVRAVGLGFRAVLPSMLEQGYGVIVSTASAAALVGLPDRAAYSASKAAVIALSRQVAVQYAGRGIRSNTVCPGTVDSPWVARLLSGAEDPDAAREELVARQPLGRLAAPREVADAMLYLASDQAAFVTGTDLVIDGGILAR